MRAELERYFEQELRALRDELRAYAQDHPDAAARLAIDETGEGYPDLERIVHGAALLNARTARRIDDGFPEVLEGFLNVVAPHYLRPFPSTAVLQLTLGESLASQADGVRLSAPKTGSGSSGADLFAVDTQSGDICRYRTCRDLTIRPLTVSGVEMVGPERYRVALSSIPQSKCVSALRFQVKTLSPQVPLSSLDWTEGLELYLKEDRKETFELYAFMLQHCVGAAVSVPGNPNPTELRGKVAQPGGFFGDENLLAYPDRSFPGFGLLTELFSAPQRFSFIRLDRNAFAGCEASEAWIHLFFDQESESLEAKVRDGWLLPNCAVVVNLFTPETGSTSIPDDPAVNEVPVVVDPTGTEDRTLASRYEVYSVDGVERWNSQTGLVETYSPVYSQVPGNPQMDQTRCYWARREYVSGPGGPDDVLGSDVYLQTADLAPEDFDTDLISEEENWFFRIKTTVMNRKPPISGSNPFRLASPKMGVSVDCVSPPTAALRPAGASRKLWRAVSQLALNHLSLLDAKSLKEILHVHALHSGTEARRLVNSIVNCESEQAFERLKQGRQSAMVSGIRVKLTVDSSDLPAGQGYLLLSVLARFLTRYATINSLVSVAGYLVGQDEPIGVWSSFGRTPVV